jgi:hypothetical protein
MSGMDDILARLRLNDARKTTPTQAEAAKLTGDPGILEKLDTNVPDAQKTVKECKDRSDQIVIKSPALSFGSDEATAESSVSGSGSQSFDLAKSESAEMLRMKHELEAAKSVISRQELELAETRTLKTTMDQATTSPSEFDYSGPSEISDQTIGHLQSAFNATARPFTSHNPHWRSQEEGRSGQSEFSARSFSDYRGNWSNESVPSLGHMPELTNASSLMTNTRDTRASGYPFGAVYGSQPKVNIATDLRGSRIFSGPSAVGFGYNARASNDLPVPSTTSTGRRNTHQYRSNSSMIDGLTPFGSVPNAVSITSPPLNAFDAPGQFGLSPHQMALQTSPVSPAFPPGLLSNYGSQWPVNVS